MEKITNVKALEYVIENFEADLPADVFEKLGKIKASFEKKSENRKATATQTENIGFKENILAVLADGGSYTVTEIQGKDTALGALSNQRVSALLRQLIDDGKVEKTVDKKKSYFKAV
jgi:hypothetical protein